MKQILLNQGKCTLVDDDDYEFLSQWKWSVCRGYAIRSEYLGMDGKKVKNKTLYMHRIINKTEKNICTDHIDGDCLNNQKNNLRNCTRTQNMMNRGSHKRFSSQYKGVSFKKSGNKWAAYIRLNGKLKHLGYFASELEAAKMYNSHALENFRDFARLNILAEVA